VCYYSGMETEEKTSNMFWIALAILLLIGLGVVFYIGTHNKSNSERAQEASQKTDQSRQKYLDAKEKAGQ
jgi:uncharacterized protein HemX